MKHAQAYATFLNDIIQGLSGPEKTLPTKYHYDERGSQLFEKICELQEYYPTRTELSILSTYAPEMADTIGPEALLIEYGSGSSQKTRPLLDRLKDPAGYVPVDVSRDHLKTTAQSLRAAYPHLAILPVCADFTKTFELPADCSSAKRKVVYFPGSTIGNLQPNEATQLLSSAAALCRPGGGLLIGVDLKKDPRMIEAAYNDSKGVTRLFSLNILIHINRVLGADFCIEQFGHRAVYNTREGRVEVSLVSLQDQTVHLNGIVLDFPKGETIQTEYSYKYDPDGFSRMAQDAGWTSQRFWTDQASLFGVFYFTVK